MVFRRPEINQNPPAPRSAPGPSPAAKTRTARQATPSPDRRVSRTRAALRDALLALLLERGWDGVDILTQCERANIGRSTFYLHYPNKEALLQGAFNDLRAALGQGAARSVRPPSGQLAFVGGLIAHVQQQQQVFRAMLTRRSGHVVQERFRELLVDLVTDEWPATLRRSWQAQATIHALAGALFQLLVWWLGARRPHSAAEVEAQFHAISRPVLKSAAALSA